MKTLLALVATTGLGTAGYYTLSPASTTPNPGTQPITPPADLPPIAVPPAQPEQTQPIQFTGPNPPGGLPANLTCNVLVNGAPSGSFPMAWDGVGWRGFVSVGSSGNRAVFFRVANGSQAGLPFTIGAVIVAPMTYPSHFSHSGYYGLYTPTPFQASVPVGYEWSAFVGGASVVFVFTG